MTLSELFIRRPVLATIMTLIVVLFGLLSWTRLSVRHYPDITAPIVSVRTVYPGATATLIEADVTTILEDALSGIDSIRTMTSTSQEEVSQITVEFDPRRDLDAAANDVRDRVFSARRLLPRGIDDPLVSKASADAQAIAWLSLRSDRYSQLELTDYAERYLKDRLAAIPGVATVWIWGARRYAMRVWLDADRLSARQLTVQDVEDALAAQNVAIPSGRIEGDRLEFGVRTRGELQTAQQFNRLIIASRDDYPIRLEDVGLAELGPEDDRKLVRFNGSPAVGVGVVKQSKANALAVGREVRSAFEELRRATPEGMTLAMASDSSVYIERSIREVYAALAVSLGLVVLVLLLFLQSLRATVVPVVAIPTSIIGSATFLYLFGYSINLLTLLGMVLAVGLVVDDAIVMLENIHRRREQGLSALAAAIQGSREITFAVLATTISLAAVFLPLLFLHGTTIRLFAEMAVAVAGAVLLSGFVALTLTPMMSARVLAHGRRSAPRRAGFGGGWNWTWVADRYRDALRRVLHAPARMVLVGLGLLLLSGGLYIAMPSELAPLEDTGAFMIAMAAPEGATIRYTDEYVRQMERALTGDPDVQTYLTWVATGSRPSRVARAGSWVTLTDWEHRSRAQQEIVASLAPVLASIPGLEAYPVQPPPFEQAGLKAPVQLVLGGASYAELERAVALVVERLRRDPGVVNVQTDLELNKPELDVHVDRNKAADLGVSVSVIGRTLETLLGGRVVTTFDHDGREHPVLVKLAERERAKPADIGALYVRGHESALVQLGNLVTVEETVVATELNHTDKMRAATVSAGVAPGHALGDVVAELGDWARQALPPTIRLTFGGESQAFLQASGELATVFLLACVVIYLVLAAQFESFLHPLTILLSVPPAVTGALLALKLTGGTLNVYSEIGLIMLLGLVTKNAILIVDFANQLRARGADAVSAIVDGAALRLRPIAMTTLATMLGAVPLACADGAGAAGRRQIGSVIIGGMLVSTLVTLFIVPATHAIVSALLSRLRARAITRNPDSDPDILSPMVPTYAGKDL